MSSMIDKGPPQSFPISTCRGSQFREISNNFFQAVRRRDQNPIVGGSSSKNFARSTRSGPACGQQALVSRKSLTYHVGISACRPRLAKSTSRFVRVNISAAPLAECLQLVVAARGIAVLAFVRVLTHPLRLRFQQVCSSKNGTTSLTNRPGFNRRDERFIVEVMPSVGIN